MEDACAWRLLTWGCCRTPTNTQSLTDKGSESNGMGIQDDWRPFICCSLHLPSQTFERGFHFFSAWSTVEVFLESGTSPSPLPPWETLPGAWRSRRPCSQGRWNTQASSPRQVTDPQWRFTDKGCGIKVLLPRVCDYHISWVLQLMSEFRSVILKACKVSMCVCVGGSYSCCSIGP